jgi:uncharacterized membrane protein YdjX (TVP38/TMEM64 family)
MRRRWARPLLATLAALLVVGFVARSGIFDEVSVEGLRTLIESYGTLAPLVFMGLVIGGLFLPGPELLLVGLGGAIFGWWHGFLYGWIAGVVGTALPFLLVRQAVGQYVHRPDGVRFQRLRAIDQRLVERGFATVLVLRLILCLAPPLNWALGATRVRWRDYVLGTAIGVTPGIGLGAYLGDAVTAAGSWTALVTPAVVVPGAVAVCGIVGGAIVARRVFGGAAR